MQLLHCHFDEFSALEVRCCEFFDVFRVHLGIRFIGAQAVARFLDLPAFTNPLPNCCRTF